MTQRTIPLSSEIQNNVNPEEPASELKQAQKGKQLQASPVLGSLSPHRGQTQCRYDLYNRNSLSGKRYFARFGLLTPQIRWLARQRTLSWQNGQATPTFSTASLPDSQRPFTPSSSLIFASQIRPFQCLLPLIRQKNRSPPPHVQVTSICLQKTKRPVTS